jgi:hypothetical protein
MSLLYRTIILVSCYLLLASCGKDDNYTAYFGGQVANPRVNYVLFSKDNKVIDTLRLDKNNRFFIKFDSLTPGLYTFKHEPDYQYVYFDKNDSIMVSINPSDFDQSIVFSGRGDRKNNFMMELFLMHESDRNAGYGIYDYDYNKFRKNIDSTYSLKKEYYNKSKADIKWNDDFDFYAKSRLNLNYYTKKEYYPYVHARRTGKNTLPQLPKDFYDFRKTMDFNDPKLINYSPYIRYLTAMVNNMAITNGFKKGSLQEDPLRDNIRKLDMTDSVFSNKIVKNEMLNNIAFSYLLEDQNITNNQKFLQRYMQLSSDTSKDNEIRKIGEAIKLLKEGAKLPEVSLESTEGHPFDPEKDIKKETVIFFWTSCARAQLAPMYDKVKALQAQYPNVDFIAVNVDEHSEWKKRVGQFDNKSVIHLRANDFYELRDKWVITKISRTIILNSDGTIKNAFTNLMEPDFAQELKIRPKS